MEYLGSPRYQRLERIGEGTYGVVYRAKDVQTGKVVALKKIKLENAEDGLPSTVLRETSLLKELKHQNIVRLQDIVHGHKKLCLVFEFVDLDLKQHMDDETTLRFQTPLLKAYLFQILSGVAYLHQRKILHRDLKPQNLLIDRISHVLKLADFGLARAFGVPCCPYTHEVVTLWYRAPEILMGAEHYSMPVDVWSIGCIFAELFNGRPLFQGEAEIEQLYEIFKVLGTPTEKTWPGVASLRDYRPEFPMWRPQSLTSAVPTLGDVGLDLLGRMLTYSPQHRITARQALEHPFFKDYDPGMHRIGLC